MMTLYEIIDLVARTTSTNEKVKILENHKSNELLKFYFKACLDTSVQYFIKKIPEYTAGSLTPITDEKKYFLDGVENILNAFSSRIYTGNQAIEFLTKLLECGTIKNAKLVENIIRRDPKCNVAAALVNRVWEGLLPEDIKLCKAMAYSSKNMKNIKYPAYSQRKADAARMMAHKDKDGNITLWSSGNNKFLNLHNLAKEIDRFIVNNYWLDGELVFEENGVPLPRKESNGLATKSIKGTIQYHEQALATFVVWDIISDPEYRGNLSIGEKYQERMKKLENQFYTDTYNHIKLIDSCVVENENEALSHFRAMLSEGEEGTILKNMDFLWEGKRLKDCVKFKLIVENTFQVTGFNYGKKGSKYEDVLGSLECQSSDGKVVVNVSGFSDEDRNNLNPKNTIGSFIEVAHNGLIEAEDGTFSVYLPRFTGFRFDKTEADSFDVIKANQSSSEQLK